jgi:hypothetical protein
MYIVVASSQIHINTLIVLHLHLEEINYDSFLSILPLL